jgi:hypothetical protein
MSEIILNDGQEEAKAQILESIRDRVRFHTLIGNAGFGKTFLTADTIRDVPAGVVIYCAAPTHKAVKVIHDMTVKAGINHKVKCATIHSILGLKMVERGQEEICIPDPYATPKYCDVMFLDECSMIDDDMIGYIMESSIRTVVFIGDPAQLPPVNDHDKESSTFTGVDFYSRLSEPVRQALESPIITLATALRLCQESDELHLPQIQTALNDKGEGIHVLKYAQFLEEFYKYVISDDFISNSNYARCLGFTNDHVDSINDYVRKRMHGEDVAPWIEGELIVAQEAGTKAKFPIYKNAEEFIIHEIEIDMIEIDDKEYQFRELTIVSNDDGKQHKMKVIHEESAGELAFSLQRYADLARSDKAGASGHWKRFWALKKTFTTFKHIYAQTIHKSQGSTYTNTFISTPDVLQYGITILTKKLLYTGTTRSTTNTFFAY